MRTFVAALLLALALPAVASAGGNKVPIEAGPIWNNGDAQQKCPQIAQSNGGTWDGKWWTTVPGRMSVCEVKFPGHNGNYVVRDIEAGPIWNNADAQNKCAQVAQNNGGTWNGKWHTTVPGQMSVCQIRIPVWR